MLVHNVIHCTNKDKQITLSLSIVKIVICYICTAGVHRVQDTSICISPYERRASALHLKALRSSYSCACRSAVS